MLKVKSLYVSFTKEYYTLNDISFNLKSGEKLTIVGNKESGRTALLRALLKLETIAKGEVMLKDIPLEKVDFQNDLSLGYLPAIPVFLGKKTVQENIEYIASLRSQDKAYINARVQNALAEFGLEYIKKKRACELNYYDKLKLSLARLSTRNIDILFVDDVFSKLSTIERDKIIKLIKSLIKGQSCTALVMVENDEIADKLGYNKKYLIYGSLKDEPDYELK